MVALKSPNNAFERPVTPFARARVRRARHLRAPSARLGAPRSAAQRER